MNASRHADLAASHRRLAAKEPIPAVAAAHVRFAEQHESAVAELDASDCPLCDGFGRIWNNADPTSGQFVACSCERGTDDPPGL